MLRPGLVIQSNFGRVKLVDRHYMPCGDRWDIEYPDGSRVRNIPEIALGGFRVADEARADAVPAGIAA